MSYHTHRHHAFRGSHRPQHHHRRVPPHNTFNYNDKECPVCHVFFPGRIPQRVFESHVQSHFN
jgi:hypothetical protein